MSAANKAIARRFVEEVWGGGDLELSNQLLAPDCIDHNPGPGLTPDRAGHNQLVHRVRAAFPGARFTLDDVLAEGDRVVGRWTMVGVHAGPFAGLPATGRSVQFAGIDILRIENGRVAELWHVLDSAGLQQQLGSPAPPDPLSAEGQAQRLERASAEIAAALRRPEVAARVRAAGPDEWSAVQVMGHVIELVSYWTREIQVLADAAGDPPHFGRGLDAPERLAAVAHGARTDPDELLRQLDSAVRASAAALRAMTPGQRARTGVHDRRGELTVAEFIEVLIVTHVEGHLAQIQLVVGAPA